MRKTGFLREEFRMDIFDSSTPFKLLLISLISTIFVIYPNIAFYSFEHNYLGEKTYCSLIIFHLQVSLLPDPDLDTFKTKPSEN